MLLLLFFCSPFPPIADGPYTPIYEFVTSKWKPHGGYLSDQIAIVDGSTGLQRTFHDYYITASGLAAALQQDMGIHEDSCVAMYCPNHVDYAPITLAVGLCGARMTPINPLYTKHELEVVLTKSRSSVLIVHVSKLDVALDTVKNCPRIKHVIVVTDDNGETIPQGTINLNDTRQHEHTFDSTVQQIHHKTETHPFLLPYSSGTTGQPKGVCLTHSNIVANLLQAEQSESLAFGPDQKLISPLPFFHIYAFTFSMLYCAWQGQQIITMSGRFDLERFCQLVEEHQPERAHLVPPIILGLAKHPIVDNYNLSSMKMIVSAAAPLSVDTEQAVNKRIGTQVKQAWGMSELSPIGTINSDFDSKSGSIGPPAASTAAKVVDERGKSLGPNMHGELMIHGPQVMLGMYSCMLV
jgi:4-coumarate--CoA ligase